MISALTGDGVGDLASHLAALAPEGPWMFPEDQLSDMPERLMAAEVTREKLFMQTHPEVPYEVTVETEAWEAFRDGRVKISQIDYVQRESPQPTVLCKGGRRLQAVDAAARHALTPLPGCRSILCLNI